jgi:hypothetical protein
MRISSKAAASAALMLLAGCGGGGGGSDDGGGDVAVPMSTKPDVLRELSLLGNIAYELGYSINPAPMATPRRSPMHQASLSRFKQQTPSRKKASVAAATGDGCDSGSVSRSNGNKNVSYSYFGSSAASDYEISDYRDCVIDYSGDGYVDTDYDNGRIELGASNNDASEVQYGYGQFGSGNTPELYRNHYQVQGQAAEDSETQTLGRVEFRSLQDGRFDQLLVASFDYRENNSYSLSLDLGQGSAPFKLVEFGDGSLSIDGPYRYSSSECAGGTATSITNQALTVDSQTGNVDGGQVRINAGSNWVTLTFNADGSAGYLLSNGLSGTLNSAEVYDSLQTPEC